MKAAALALLVAALATVSANYPPYGPPSDPPPSTNPPPSTTEASGGGDPIMTGFDGRTFEFFGAAGSTYNVLSEKSHQLSMKLKEGKMWDHAGSYIQALGFRYQNSTVEVTEDDGIMSVALNGEALTLRKDQTELETIMGLASGEMSLLWQLHRPEHGNAVEITTDMLNILIWLTPAGTRDEGGIVQPAYLNFELALLASPAHNALEGIIGRTFSASNEEDDFKFHGEEADYEMASFFEAAHPKSLFGKATGGGMIRARKLIQTEMTYPLKAGLSALAKK